MTNDRIQSHGLDVAKALGARGTGLVWTAVENGASIPNAKRSVQAAARVARAGDEPRRDGQGQPAEHAGLRDAPRQRRAGRRRQGLDHQPRQQHPLERHDRRRRRRDRPWHSLSRAPLHRRRGLRRVAEARLRRPGREGRRHRLRRQQLERGHRAVGLRRARSIAAKPSRCCAARSSAIAACIAWAKKSTSRPSSVRTRRAAFGCCARNAGRRSRCATASTASSTSARSRSTTGAAPSGRRRCRAEGALGNYSVRAVLESDKPKPKTPRTCEPGDVPSPELDDDGAIPEGGQRVVSGRGVPASGLSRRRDAEGRARAGRRAAQGRRDGALPLWRADGCASGEVGVLAIADSLGAGRRRRQVPGRAVGCSWAGASGATAAMAGEVSRDEAHARARRASCR